MLKNCKNELELYKLLANDDVFKSTTQENLKRVVDWYRKEWGGLRRYVWFLPVVLWSCLSSRLNMPITN